MPFLIRFCHGSTRLPTLTAMFHYHTPFSLSVSSLITAARSSSSYPILQTPPHKHHAQNTLQEPIPILLLYFPTTVRHHPQHPNHFSPPPVTTLNATPEPKPPDPAETSSHPLPDRLDEEIPSPETLPSVVGEAEIVRRNRALLWSALER